MPTETHCFPKSEKLCGLTTINRVFSEGNRIKIYPFRCVWLKSESNQNVRIMFSVPKKHFHHAVDRNLFKRRMREAYRLNNSILKNTCSLQNIGLDIAIVYNSSEKLDYSSIEKRMIGLLSKLQSAVGEMQIEC